MEGKVLRVPFLALMVFAFLSGVQGFSCDSGDLSSTCNVSSVQDITSETVSGDGSLIIETDGRLETVNGPGSSAEINVSEIEVKGVLSGNFNISADRVEVVQGGSIDASGKGFEWNGENSDSGPGWGHGPHRCGVGLPDGAGGGGYFAAKGGNGYFHLESGDTSPEDQTGQTYGKKKKAVRLGSAGGNGCDDSRGANGGGRIKVETNKAQIDGTITASGSNGQCCNSNDGNQGARGSGGGSGGSIRIYTENLSGTGILKSNGGNGANDGGGGSGGRIAIYYGENGTETPDTSLNGGSGYNTGGKGTLYFNQTEFDFCGIRGPKNECIMEGQKNLEPETYNINNIFISQKTALISSLNGLAILNISNSSKISGTWKGNVEIGSKSPRIIPGAKFRPENGEIKIGE
jgi:hypothetical protein